MDVITYLCWELSWSMLVKGVPDQQKNIIEFGAWINDYIHIISMDVITHPCINSVAPLGSLARPPLELGYGWDKTIAANYHIMTCDYFIHVPNLR